MRSISAMCALIVGAAVCLFVPRSVVADDGYWSGSIAGVGPGYSVQYIHQDAEPYKGFINLTVTNSGSDPWGDFHFEIFDPIGGQNIANVDFLDSTTIPPGPDPTSSQSPLSWVIDNVSVGATIDLFFYSDPVLPGQTATFSVYTNNPDQLSFFGVAFWPTPIPEPAALALLIVGMLVRRRW